MLLNRIFHFEAMGFLFALGAVVLFKIATRQINTEGLITNKDGTAFVSPVRVQLLLATIAASATYLGQVASNKTGTMPDVSPHMIYLFGGSSGIYAAGKAWTFFNLKKRGLGGSS